MTVPDPTPGDVTRLANALREAERLGLIQADSIAHHVWPVILQRDARIRAETLREAVAEVRAVYDLQCPVSPRSLGIEYVPGARMAHKWWEKVLGGTLDDLAALAARIERGESL